MSKSTNFIDFKEYFQNFFFKKLTKFELLALKIKIQKLIGEDYKKSPEF